MKGLLIAFAGVTLGASSASAQLLGVDTSVLATWWDTEDLGDAYGGQIGVEFAFLHWFSVEGRTGYLRADRHELDIVPLEALAAFRLSLFDVLKPYGGVGVGQYFFDSSEISTEDRQAVFPLLGLDVHLPTTKLTLTAEARWMFFSDSISDELASSDADGLAFSLGASFRF